MSLSDDELMDLLRSRLNQKSSSLQDTDMFREMERLSARLKRAERMKSNFLSNIRNEVNNPMSSVLGLSKALLSTDRLDQRQVERYATLIHQEAFYLDFQMKNIFAAAEIEAGETKIHSGIVDVRQLVEQIEQALFFKMSRKSVGIKTSFSMEAVLFCTDAYMLHLIIVNLLSNAIEFTKEDTVVNVNITCDEKRLSITVRDHGDGIAPKDRARIFERFSQLDEGSTKRHAGQGLGLAIIAETVALLSGSIEVTSESGAGSEFKLTLPSFDLSNFDNSTRSEEWNEFLFGNDTVL